MQKLLAFTKKVADLPDKPTLNPSELKQQFDAAPEELRTYFNQLIDDLANPGTVYPVSLQNGWTGTIQYQCNSLGQVRLLLDVTSGTVSNLTVIGNVSAGFRPAKTIAIPLVDRVGGTVIPAGLYIHEDGNIRTTSGNGLTTNVLYQAEIIYYTAK